MDANSWLARIVAKTIKEKLMDKKSSIEFIIKKYNLDPNQEMPIRIPDTDRYETLTKLYAELGYKEGAEIGVAEGTFSKSICENNLGVKLHCIDPWEKYPGYNDFAGDFFAQAEQKAREMLEPYNCNIIKKYSQDALKDISNKSLDFVYIDANHDVRHVIDDIDDWDKKVRDGGMISGHDWFISQSRPDILQVVYALDAYTKAWRINPWFVLGRDERLPNEKRERSRSWFWVQ